MIRRVAAAIVVFVSGVRWEHVGAPGQIIDRHSLIWANCSAGINTTAVYTLTSKSPPPCVVLRESRDGHIGRRLLSLNWCFSMVVVTFVNYVNKWHNGNYEV